MTKRKDWPEESHSTELADATIATLEFLEAMIRNGGHAGAASDLPTLAARLRAAMYPES